MTFTKTLKNSNDICSEIKDEIFRDSEELSDDIFYESCEDIPMIQNSHASKVVDINQYFLDEKLQENDVLSDT